MKYTPEETERDADRVFDLMVQLDPEVIRWVEAFASCAIEGNVPAKEMMDLWNSGKRREFVKQLNEKWL